MKTLIYLHGFLSTGNSRKAAVLREAAPAFGWRVQAPDLNTSPEEACRIIENLYTKAAKEGQVAFVGGSLGGFFAAWIAEKTGARAVLVNPAVTPWEIVEEYLGPQTVADGRTLVVKPEFADQLRDIAVKAFSVPSRILLMLTTGDEVLDWREAAAKYHDSASVIVDGSDHMMSDFADYVESVMRFVDGDN